jgi:hypothetical protein
LGLFNTTTEFDMSKNHIVTVVFDTSPNPNGGPLVQHVEIKKELSPFSRLWGLGC